MYSGCASLIPKNLVCVLFGIVIPTSFFNFIQLFLHLYKITHQQWALTIAPIFFRYPSVPQKGYDIPYTCDLATFVGSSDIFPYSFIAPLVLTQDDTEWGYSWARWIAYRSFFKMPETSPYKKTKRSRLTTFGSHMVSIFHSAKNNFAVQETDRQAFPIRGLRSHQKQSQRLNIKKFPGGAYPQTP